MKKINHFERFAVARKSLTEIKEHLDELQRDYTQLKAQKRSRYWQVIASAFETGRTAIAPMTKPHREASADFAEDILEEAYRLAHDFDILDKRADNLKSKLTMKLTT